MRVDSTSFDRICTFGLVMIVKNGAHLLYRILDQIAPSDKDGIGFDQVVILDTGSTDGTVQLLKDKYPWVEVHEAKWEFDFSIARNQALKYVNTDLWMWLDADDTFTSETLKRWFEIAKELWSNRTTPGHPVYALIPYIYEVDKNDLPVVVHYRERIMLGTEGWEWREPLHEVCYYNLPDGHFVAYNDCPVVHRPIGTDNAKVNGDRNWKIMMRNYLTEDKSDRTLYYMGRMANARHQWEFAIQISQQLLSRSPGGYYEYEAAVACGEAYAELFKRDDIEAYKAKAIEFLTIAKRYEPTRNDARQKLCDLYIFSRDTKLAIKEAEGLNEAMPATVATTLPAYYGKYKYSVLALIYFRLVGNVWLAMGNHFKALDCPKPHASSLQLDSAIRAYLDDHDIGVIYADEKYVNQAMGLRKILLQRGTFKEVLVFNDTHCLSFASKYYFHFTEKLDTLYKEDGHPRLRKFLVTPRPLEEHPLGYESVICMPDTPSMLEASLDEALSPCTLVSGQYEPLSEIFEQTMRCRSERVCISFVTDLNDCLMQYEKSNPTQFDRLKFVVNRIGECFGIIGWTESVTSLFVDEFGIVRTHALDNIDFVIADESFGFDLDKPGVKIRVESVGQPKKVIHIVAPGIEDWDGTTPRKWGIGASESCVVYLAEELVKRGHQVIVYNTTFKSRIVAGVGYIHMAQYHDTGQLCDLYISSRIPEALTGRRGKMQVLWMHDIPESYTYRITNDQVIDRYVAVSEWQLQQAIKCNLKASKCVHIPNGIKPWKSFGKRRNDTRVIWSSQPERGLDNLHRFWQKKPDLFSDVWVIYGFYNLLVYGKARNNMELTEEAFYDTCRYKYALRQMKARIVGRIPHYQVSQLAQASGRWIYPSVFPETFCVAGLEMLYNGVQCYYTNNGATSEILGKAGLPDVADGREVRRINLSHAVDGPAFEFDLDANDWVDMLSTHLLTGTREIGFSNTDFYWSRIADQWEELINA
jgi:glycosyltransferase involved in cell wall biosynthesis